MTALSRLLSEKASFSGCDSAVFCVEITLSSQHHSPICHLPNEMLGKIFSYSLPGSDTPTTPLSTPLVFLQVCSHWRAIALSLSELWQTLNIGAGFALNPFRVFSLFTKHARKRTMNLTLSIELWIPKVKIPLERLSLFYELVRGTIPRVKLLCGDISLEGMVAIFHPECSPSEVHLPNLMHLDVQRPPSLRGVKYRIPTRIDAIHLANLQSLRLYDLGFFSISIINSGCPLRKLRTLEVGGQLEAGMLSHEHFARLLILVQNIENCRWTVGKEVGNVYSVGIQDVVHRHLKSMQLTLDQRSVYPTAVLERLHAVQSLKMTFVVND